MNWMNKIIVALHILFLLSSCHKAPSAIGEYVYMEGSLVHSYKNCHASENTTLAKSHDLFQNTHKHLGKYYRNAEQENFWEVRFCGSCISESMMSAIEDSIAKYDVDYE